MGRPKKGLHKRQWSFGLAGAVLSNRLRDNHLVRYGQVWFRIDLMIGKRASLLLSAGIAVAALWFGAVNYSVTANEYTCDGFTSVGRAPKEPDHGRLRIEHYVFFVVLWNPSSDGNATFQSTKFSFNEGYLKKIGEGNSTFHVGTSFGGKFAFERATDELAIDYGQMSFLGNCIAVL